MSNQPNTDLLDKIKALLSMTEENGCSENEAQNAASLASRLLLKHGLDMATVEAHTSDKELEDKVDGTRYTVDQLHRGAYSWQIRLADDVAHVMLCKALFCGKYQGSKTLTVEFIGRRTNVDAAIQLYQFLLKQFNVIAAKKIQEAYAEQMIRYGNFTIGKMWRKSFLIGISNRVRVRLIEEFVNDVQEMGAQDHVIVRFDECAIYVAAKRTGTVKDTTSKRLNPEAYAKGVHAGNSVKFARDKEIVSGTKALPG